MTLKLVIFSYIKACIQYGVLDFNPKLGSIAPKVCWESWESSWMSESVCEKLFNGQPWLPFEHPISSQKSETPGVGPPSSVSAVGADGLVGPVYTSAPIHQIAAAQMENNWWAVKN